MDGQAVSLVFGYPDAAGIGLAVQDTATGFTATTVGSTITFTKTGAATPATCIASYTAAAATNTAPAIAGNTAGC
jgi:MSHA pilin protein MshA